MIDIIDLGWVLGVNRVWLFNWQCSSNITCNDLGDGEFIDQHQIGIGKIIDCYCVGEEYLLVSFVSRDIHLEFNI